MDKDTFIWLVIGVGLLLLCLFVVRQPSTRRHNCQGKEQQTIFVMMHAYKSNAETVFTMTQMIQAASCPYRLTFGLYQDVKKEQDVFDMYQQVAGDLNRSEDIRVLSRPAAQTTGSYDSILKILHRLYKHEQFILLTQPGTVFVDGFDDVLIQHVPKGGGVLTGCGVRKQSKQSKWMGYLNATLPAYLPRKALDQTSSFPVLVQKPGTMPEVRGASTNAAQQPYHALCADARMLFFHANMVHVMEDVGLHPATMDLFLTAMLYHHGIRMYVCPRTVAWGPSTIKHAIGPHYDERACVEWLRAQKEWLVYLGLDDRLRPCGRARMGLLPDHRDKLIKYKNETYFQRQRTRYQARD